LDGGLAHYVPGGWNKIDKKNAPLADSQIWSLLETISASGNPVYWFGTTTGLARMEEGRWSTFSTENSPLPNDYILSLLETKSSTGERALWIGTNGGGVARLEAGRWTTFNSNNSGLPGNVVIALLETSAESGHQILWAGTEGGGLARYENGQWTAFNTSNSGLPDNKVLTLLETSSPAGQRALWVGTNGGLARYENGQWASFTTSNSALPNNQVWGLRETVNNAAQRHLWVGTAGGGVARFDQTPSRGGFDLAQATFKAFANYTVWQIQTDAKKRIYLSTDKGVAQLTPRTPTADDPAEYAMYIFTTEDGLPSNGCNQGAFISDSKGRFWVGTGDGAAVFDPDNHIEDLTPKPLLIERTLQGGKERAMPEQASFAYHENNFQFEYALLSYFREPDTRYRFQLVGFDGEASDWMTETRKEYTNLGEGSYVFKVWARDYAGNVSGPVLKAFAIRAAPWRTWWAYGIYTLGVGLMAYAVVRVQVNRVHRRAAAILEKQKEQARLKEAELRAEAAEIQAQAIEAENRRKSEELNFARQLQLSMLPKQNIRLEKVEIVGQMRTATEVGGDYYDFIKIDDHHYCVAIGDATGHGVGAGLVVGMVKTALLNSVLLLGPEATVEQLMVDLNQTLKASLTHRGVGMCFSIALIDLETMTAEVGSTGMPFPCFYQGQSGQVETIEMPGPPLGFMKKIKARSHKVQLGPQDRLIFLSDGFHERMNAAGECWGYESVTREVARICQVESGGEAIASRLISACDQFAQERETDDDMTVLIVCVNSHQPDNPDNNDVSEARP
jgi:serine phosphatase RsbU (regulator of sigma subunit)